MKKQFDMYKIEIIPKYDEYKYRIIRISQPRIINLKKQS
jgi:hypothetical protein